MQTPNTEISAANSRDKFLLFNEKTLLKGTSFKFSNEWDDSTIYYNDDYIVEFVTMSSNLYVCTKTNKNHNPLELGIYWQKVTNSRDLYQVWLDTGHTGTEEDFLEWNRSAVDPTEILAAKNAALEAASQADLATLSALDAAGVVDEIVSHPNQVINNYWHKWNTETNQYETLNIKAVEEIEYATFELDPITGELSITVDPTLENTTFSLEDGHLVIEIQ